MLNANFANFQAAPLAGKSHFSIETCANQIKDFLEMALTKCLDSTANQVRTEYPGVDL